MPLDFLLLYEHPVREYESLLLLQRELERRGYTVRIRQLMDRKKISLFTWNKPRVLVASNLYDNEGLNSHVYNNVGRLERVVNLHWEQMLSDTQEEEPWFNFDGNAKKCVQTCWGEKTKQRLTSHGMKAENAPVTGAIMMDFLRPEFSGYYRDKAALCAACNLDAKRPLWLYISSFAYASMGSGEVAELSRMAGTDFTLFAEINRQSMAETLRWFDLYLGENPEVQLVYRPHPSEWKSPALAALAQKRPNFIVLFEDSVQQWITAADEIFVWMSTAVAEVYFANKSCRVLRPYPLPHQFDPVIYKDARCVTSYEAFAEGEDPNTPFPIPPATLEGYFDSGPLPAYRRMADLLEEVYQKEPRDTPFDSAFRPRINRLKWIALAGAHLLWALKIDPRRLSKAQTGPFALAGRVYGYIDKAKITKERQAALQKRILPFVR